MVCREVVKLLDASFTFLERWAFLTVVRFIVLPADATTYRLLDYCGSGVECAHRYMGRVCAGRPEIWQPAIVVTGRLHRMSFPATRLRSRLRHQGKGTRRGPQSSIPSQCDRSTDFPIQAVAPRQEGNGAKFPRAAWRLQGGYSDPGMSRRR